MEFPRPFSDGALNGISQKLGPGAQLRVIGVEAAEVGVRNTIGLEAVAYGHGDAIQPESVEAQHVTLE
jgi:hypothetical protein